MTVQSFERNRRANKLITPPSGRHLKKSISQDLAKTHADRLSEEFFGHAAIGPTIMSTLVTSAEMSMGSQAYDRPAMRRDKMVATVKSIRRLVAHLNEFDLQTIADALGRQAPIVRPTPNNTEDSLGSGLTTASPVLSQTPAILMSYKTLLKTLGRLDEGMQALSVRQGTTRKGAAETPDSLMFAIEALAFLWAKHKGQAPQELSFKKGQFGDFTLQVLALVPHIWTASQVKTGLRRFQELKIKPR